MATNVKETQNIRVEAFKNHFEFFKSPMVDKRDNGYIKLLNGVFLLSRER